MLGGGVKKKSGQIVREIEGVKSMKTTAGLEDKPIIAVAKLDLTRCEKIWRDGS